MNSRERFVAACRQQPVDRPPVWLMRQAGRYLPEYRAVREKHDFWQMMRTPELAVEVTQQPLRRFGMDAAILFCDILVVLDAMGVEVRYQKGGPVIHPLVKDQNDLSRLQPVEAPTAFGYVREAVESLSRQLHPESALIGFAGAPFTLASYLVEKGPSQDLSHLRSLASARPEVYAEILDQVTDVVADLLALQVRAGADAVQVFDTWAGKLSREEYRELAQPWSRKVIEKLQPLGVPIVLYVRNAVDHLEAAADTGCTVLSIDSSLPLREARSRLPDGPALQGNFDPERLKEPPDVVRAEVHAMIDSVGGSGLVVNLGQGLTPETPIEGVESFVNAVKEWSL